MGHFDHEDELYNVTMAKFYSPFRPVGLRPAGRFLSPLGELWDKTTFCVGCRGPPISLNFQKFRLEVKEHGRQPSQKS